MYDITFIIPTIGRETLSNSIKSIEDQTSNNWKIIIIFDGIEPTIHTSNSKIQIIKSDKKGKDENSAGNVRNYGMSFCTTKWIAFLDDDDVISNNYVETFNNEIKEYPNIDVIIFRMCRNNIILPILDTDSFYEGFVGISFAIKTEIFKNGHKFIPSKIEDFKYLELLKNNNYKIMISPYVKYYVGTNDIDNINNGIIGNRVFINNDAVNNEGFTTNTGNKYIIMYVIALVALVGLVGLITFYKLLPILLLLFIYLIFYTINKYLCKEF